MRSTPASSGNPTGFVAAIGAAVTPSLTAAGFERAAIGWITPGRSPSPGTVAFAALEDGDRRSITFGWSFAAIGDGPPDPPDVRGCARHLPFDMVAPNNDLRSWLAFPVGAGERQQWRLRFEAAWQRAVVPHLDKWQRPDGFRDYLAARGLHLAAAWMSAALEHTDRAMAELDRAHRSLSHPLNADYDRGQAELDTAISAPLAAARGLGAYLEEAADTGRSDWVEAFEIRRGSAAQAKITTPDREHVRLQRRQAVLAEVCRRFVMGPA